MLWIVIVIGSLALLLVLYVQYIVKPYRKGKGREDLDLSLKALLFVTKDGGTLEIKDRGSDVRFVFLRTNEDQNSADLHLRIPRAPWSERLQTSLESEFADNGFEVIKGDVTADAILEVRFHVANIWAHDCSERGVEAACLALDVLGVDKEARFTFNLEGPKSWRRIVLHET